MSNEYARQKREARRTNLVLAADYEQFQDQRRAPQSRYDDKTLLDQTRSRIKRKAKSRVIRAVNPLYYPTQIIRNPNPCKRAKSAERHNVFRKKQRMGRGSIAKRTMNRIVKEVCKK